MNKRRLFIFIALLFFYSESYTQELPVYRQYTLNEHLLNPARSACISQTKINISSRMQWIGVEDAPGTYLISLHSALGNNGLGVLVFSDNNGPNHDTGIHANFARHIALSSDVHLGIGVSYTGTQFLLDQRQLTTLQANDPAINESIESRFVHNMNAGFFLQTGKWTVGLVGLQLLPAASELYNRQFEPDFCSEFYLTFDYTIRLNPHTKERKNIIIPSLVLNFNKNGEKWCDIGCQYHLNPKVGFGALYRRNIDTGTGNPNALILSVRLNYQKVSIGYGYDISLSGLQNYYGASHEVSLGYSFITKRDKTCPAYRKWK